uniref:G_PROTEIN_RECEP_F1_2 domain-containing protein n=2 Tax=Caenorhabditis tropicalis TaxID=1561998 RepID=A0A1I7U6L7_9PELO
MPPVIDHYGRTHFELEYMLPNTTVSSPSNSYSFTVNEVFAMIMLPIIVIGIFGNTVSIFVYSRKHMKKSTVGFLLLSLSIIDLIVLLTALPTFSLYKLPFIPGYMKIGSFHTILSAFCIVYVYPIGCTAKMTSQYIIVLIAVERWFAVCRPLQVQVWCTLRNTIRAMIYIVVIAIMFNAPRFLEFTADLSTGIVNMGLSHSSNNKWYFILYYGIRSIFFDTLIPFAVISVTNIQVIKQLKKSNEERKLLTTQQQKDKRTTTMLLVMVILYASCHMFNTSLKFVNLIFKTYAQFQFTLFRVLHHISNLLLVTYSMSTFFIYLIFSVKYRQVIAAVVSCRNMEELNTTSSRGKAKQFHVKTTSSNGYATIKSV